MPFNLIQDDCGAQFDRKSRVGYRICQYYTGIYIQVTARMYPLYDIAPVVMDVLTTALQIAVFV